MDKIMKEINLEEILKINASFKCTCGGFPECICKEKIDYDLYYKEEALKAMREACRQTLELAAENTGKESITDLINQIK